MLGKVLFHYDGEFLCDNDGKKYELRGGFCKLSLLPITQALAISDSFFETAQACGENYLRWLISWKNIETAPDEYDESYLTMLRTILKKCEEHNIGVFLEPAQEFVIQNIPEWAFKKTGISIKEANAAEAFVEHFWRTTPVGDFLKLHFIDAMKHTARRLKDCKAVFGFGTLTKSTHPELLGQFQKQYIESFKEKHKDYAFFVGEKNGT